MGHVLGQTVGRTFQATCDAELGDARCGINLKSASFKGTGTVADLLRDRAFLASGIGAFAEGWFSGGTVEWTSGANDGRLAEIMLHGVSSGIVTVTLLEAPGPTSRFDLANQLMVDLRTGTLESVTDLALFGGSNALAGETAPGVWEIVQGSNVDLVGPGRYRLTRLLRGQRGTEHAMAANVSPAAGVVVLDAALTRLPVAQADVGLPWNWCVGPAFTPAGVGLRPFSIGHVEQPYLRGRTPGDLTIRQRGATGPS